LLPASQEGIFTLKCGFPVTVAQKHDRFDSVPPTRTGVYNMRQLCEEHLTAFDTPKTGRTTAAR
jgi:hypothetical protein